jgi:hypothetical protein
VERVSTYTVENIIKGLAELNVSVGKAFSDLAEKLVNEANKLTELRKAIEIESSTLKEIHDITLAANTLSALIEAQNERKVTFEREMAEKQQQFEADMIRKREEWKKEQVEHDLTVKERDAVQKKQREREQEEYEYNLALARKKDADAYTGEQAALRKKLTEERAAFEKETAERSATIAAREAEFAELKKKVEQFPKELAEAVKKAADEARAAAQRQAQVEANLKEKEVEGDKRVAALKIASLEEVVAKQAAQIEALAKQLAAANTQVQDIAVKAIEGASGLKALAAVNEIALEQAKTSSLKK